MRTKDKPKLNKTLLITNLPEEVALALETYKAQHGINVNTTATIQMVMEHAKLEEEVDRLRAKVAALSEQLRDIKFHFEIQERHERMLHTVIREVNL